MDNLSIMTWNTQLYEQGNKIGGKRKPINMEIFISTINFVKAQLEKENSIAFLQEIPYCSNTTWKEHKLHKEFKISFSKIKYDVIWNVSSGNQIMMTVAIAKKGVIKKELDGFNDNRCVSVRCSKLKDIKIMGIHARNKLETKSYLDDIKKRFPLYCDIILGDFNAGDYLKMNEDDEFVENRKSYLSFTEGYIDICQGKETTQYSTQIDHILIKNNSTHRKLNYTFKIIDAIKSSDHYPIICDIEIYN